uniref:Bm715 n=1 Tax=Brugia malayi TaxID=6279 RepID=A0A1I9G5D9_BRUMA|nr:Bm715 [Brugia malayi]
MMTNAFFISSTTYFAQCRDLFLRIIVATERTVTNLPYSFSDK